MLSRSSLAISSLCSLTDAIERRDLIGGQIDGDADLRIVPPVRRRHHLQSVARSLGARACEAAAATTAAG